MKATLPRLLLAALLIAGCTTVTTATRHPLEGNWEIVSARFTAADGKVTEMAAPSQLRSLKVLGRTHFSMLTTRGDGTFVRAHAGRYTVRGNQYLEHIDLSSADVARGATYEFEWRVEGDTWYHTGTHEGIHFEEVWRRAR